LSFFFIFFSFLFPFLTYLILTSFSLLFKNLIHNIYYTPKYFAQNLDSSSNFLWQPPEGISVCTLSHCSQNQIISDGNGGFYSAWVLEEFDTTTTVGLYDFEVCLQRIYADGSHYSQENNKSGIIEFSLHPSPAYHRIYCKLPERGTEFGIYDIAGRKVLGKKITTNEFTCVLDDKQGRSLPAGVYFIRIKTPNHTFLKKFVKLR